jgi:anti-anti-sigma factor
MPSSHRQIALKVVVRHEDRETAVSHFVAREITIGRSPVCDVVLDHPLVSWTHARVVFERPGRITFTDLSSNGSFRNGQRVRQAALGRGGVMGIPPYELDFSIEMVDSATEPISTARAAAPGKSTDAVPRGPATPVAPPPAPVEPLVHIELRLVQAPGALLGSAFTILPKPMLIGRSDECDIQLDLPSISRQHARLVPIAEGRWTLQDEGSRNGVELNGERVKTAEVTAGDRIGFGPEVVGMLQAVRHEHESTSPPAPAPDRSTDTVAEALVVTRSVAPGDRRLTVLRVAGRVDGYGYAYLRDEIAGVIEQGARFLIVDLSGCTYCDHAGLGVLVNAQVALSQRRGAMRLVGLSSQLHDAFLLLRLDQVLSVSADEPTASSELERLMR